MMKRNRYRAGRKKRAKIEALKKRGIPIIVKIQSEIFLSEEACVQLNGNIEFDRVWSLNGGSTVSDTRRESY